MMEKIAGTFFDYKCQMDAEEVGKLEETDVRAVHQWAVTTLCNIQQVLLSHTNHCFKSGNISMMRVARSTSNL